MKQPPAFQLLQGRLYALAFWTEKWISILENGRICCRHESLLYKHLAGWTLQDEVQAADLELIETLSPIPPSPPSRSRCGKLQTLRICIALKLPLFIMSNWLLEKSQLVKELCSVTIGDYLLFQIILSGRPLLDWDFHLVSRNGTEDPSNETVFVSPGKAPHVWARNQRCLFRQLADTITILCFRLSIHLSLSKCLLNWIL